MDLATLVGIVLGLVMVVFGIISSADISAITKSFLDLPSFIITFGGSIAGMIGTLVGLINMLADLNDMASVGPNMATALITTLYGSLIANWLCVPIANKLKLINNNEYQMKEIVIEGLLSIQAGENPRVIEEKLKSFLSPDARGNVSDSEAGGEA